MDIVASRPATGGYTHASREIVTLRDGSTAFVKRAVDDLTAAWLRTEQHVYTALEGAAFLPQVLDMDDGVLVLEDLSGCHWPPPWRPGDVQAVHAVCAAIAATTPPDGIEDGAVWHDRLHLWPRVAADPTPFLALGLCTEEWLAEALPVLDAASERCDLGGTALQHFDLRSDNLCIRPDGRVLVVDWNMATRAAPHFDLALWLPGLESEGGPAPEAVVGERYADEAALIAGYFAAMAGLPRMPHAPRVRDVQFTQLTSALPWAARANGLSVPSPATPTPRRR